MKKKAVYIFVILTYCLSVTGQVNFDSIKICHDNYKALTQVRVKEYVVSIQNGQLSSFHSLDGIVTYNERDRKLTLKGINNEVSKLDSVSLQLTANGDVVISNRGKSTTLNEIRIVGTDTAFTVDLPAISVPVVFNKWGLNKIWVVVGNKYVTITLHHSSKGFNWDVYIATNVKENAILLSQSGGRNYFINLFDDSNKVGLRIWSDKENGTFNRIQGVRYWEEYRDFGVDGSHTLIYSQKGILKKNQWKDPLTCE